MKPLYLLILLSLVLLPKHSYAECKIISYPDRDEVVCEGIPEVKEAVIKNESQTKKITDIYYVERKAAIKSLIKLKSQSSVGVSFNRYAELLSDAMTDSKLFEAVAKNSTEEDQLLNIKIGTAITSCELTLVKWGEEIKSHHKTSWYVGSLLSESASYIDEAINFYTKTWN